MKDEWISVKERLPEVMDFKVLLCDKDGEVFQGYLSQIGTWHCMRYMGVVKYTNIEFWQPLPSPPNQGH